jgi:dUTP pyrophosphatase
MRASPGSAGLDLRAAIDFVLEPGKRALIPTGYCMAIPTGCEGQVRPRSGLAVKWGVTVLNSPGTIDSDYRGEVKVLLVNLGDERFEGRRGDRIAQLLVTRVEPAEVEVVELLEGEDRGGGFGSTGL